MAETLLNGREYFIGDLAKRFASTAERHPHDQAIRGVQQVLQKRAQRLGAFHPVSQADVQSIYDQVSSLGNRQVFAEEFGDLLIRKAAPVAHRNEAYVAGLRDSGTSMELVSPEETAKYAGLFGEKIVITASAESGRKGLETELKNLGFPQPVVAVVGRDDNFVIYSAEVSGRKGRVPFLIPAEVKLGSVLMPSVFVSGDEFRDLTTENIRNHVVNIDSIRSHAGPAAVLQTLHRLTDRPVEKIAQASDEGSSHIAMSVPEFFSNSRSESEDRPVYAIEDRAPQARMPEALAGLTQDMLDETLAEAGVSMDRNTVIAAKRMLSRELQAAGIHSDTIKVASEFDGGINLVTNISGSGGRKRIEVPIEVSAGHLQMPTIFTSGAFASSFDSASLKSFASQTEGESFDPKLSDKISMSFTQLHQFAMKKTAFGDFAEAMEALGTISEKFGHDYHRIAHDDVMDLMKAGFGEAEQPVTAMDRFIAEAAEKARNSDNQIRMNSNAMLFYPKD